MSKKIALGILIMLISNYVSAQDKGYVSLSYGYCYPMGNFGSTDVNNEKAGFADRGTSLTLSASVDLSKHFGLFLSLRRQINSMDVESLEEYYINLNPFLLWRVEASNYQSDMIIIGPTGTWRLVEHLYITGKFGSAFIKATTPEYKIRVQEPIQNNYEFIEQEESTSNDIGFFLGLDVRLNLTKSISAFLNTDYVISKPDFETNVHSTFADSERIAFIQEMRTLSVSLGLGLRF